MFPIFTIHTSGHNPRGTKLQRVRQRFMHKLKYFVDKYLGHVVDYEDFLEELGKVWEEIYRVLFPDGRLVCVVGDVCLSRRRFPGEGLPPAQIPEAHFPESSFSSLMRVCCGILDRHQPPCIWQRCYS